MPYIIVKVCQFTKKMKVMEYIFSHKVQTFLIRKLWVWNKMNLNDGQVATIFLKNVAY